MTFGRSRNILWSLSALAVVLLFDLLFTPRFFDLRIESGHLYGNLVDILNRAAPVVLTGLGMTLVIATGGIDLLVGSVMAISGAVASILITINHAPLAVVIIVPLLITTLIGLWNGVLVAFLGIQPFIATLILMVSGRGIAQLITSGQIVIFTDKPFQFIGEGDLLGLPFTVAISLLLFLVAFLGTRTTSVGTFIEAVGSNPVASSYRYPLANDEAGRLRLFRTVRRDSRADRRLRHPGRGLQQRWARHRARRDPRGGAGRDLPRRREVLPGRIGHRRESPAVGRLSRKDRPVTLTMESTT